MKRFLALCFSFLVLAACVDTKGLSADSSRKPTGNPQSSIVVTEFADLECPACKAAYTTITQPLLQKYGTQISYIYKHFPLRSIHPYAMDLAEAAECAADKGKFWEFADMAFTHQDKLGPGVINQWASSLGINDDTYSRCTRSHIKRKEILANYDEGIKLGVQGTPTFFVNGVQTPSTLTDLSAAIDAALKNAVQKL
jgi:protein-disulfide isomerase